MAPWPPSRPSRGGGLVDTVSLLVIFPDRLFDVTTLQNAPLESGDWGRDNRQCSPPRFKLVNPLNIKIRLFIRFVDDGKLSLSPSTRRHRGLYFDDLASIVGAIHWLIMSVQSIQHEFTRLQVFQD